MTTTNQTTNTNLPPLTWVRGPLLLQARPGDCWACTRVVYYSLVIQSIGLTDWLSPQCRTLHCSEVQCGRSYAIPCIAARGSSTLFHAEWCTAEQFHTVTCSSMWLHEVSCSVLQCRSVPYSSLHCPEDWGRLKVQTGPNKPPAAPFGPGPTKTWKMVQTWKLGLPAYTF